jgi:hypothetical protein
MSHPASPVHPKHWVPDEEGAACSICHAEFSITRRRHHCRKCGSLVCGSCSDHFVQIDDSGSTSNTPSPVRVCDKCEVKLRDGSKQLSDEIDINDQIGVSLKTSLKEKVHELEKFESLIMHTLETQSVPISPSESGDKELRLKIFSETISQICSELREVSSLYSDMKMASKDLEGEIRAVAQRCLRFESISREGADTAREIEKFSKQIGAHDRLILQLNERIQRLGEPPSSPRRPSSEQSPGSPPPQMASTLISSASSTDATNVVAPSVSIRQVLKALVSI